MQRGMHLKIIIFAILFVLATAQRDIQIQPGRYEPEIHTATSKYFHDDRGKYVHQVVPYVHEENKYDHQVYGTKAVYSGKTVTGGGTGGRTGANRIGTGFSRPSQTTSRVVSSRPVVSTSRVTARPAIATNVVSARPAVSTSRVTARPAIASNVVSARPAVATSRVAARPAIATNLVGSRPAVATGRVAARPAISTSRVIAKPAVVVSRPASVVSRPAAVVSRPASVVSRPAAVVSRPAAVVSRPAIATSRPAITTSRVTARPSTSRVAGSSFGVSSNQIPGSGYQYGIGIDSSAKRPREVPFEESTTIEDTIAEESPVFPNTNQPDIVYPEEINDLVETMVLQENEFNDSEKYAPSQNDEEQFQA